MSKRARSTCCPSVNFRVENKVSANIATRMFLNENSADFHFVFKAESVRVPAHKVILATASDVFATMLNGGWQENNEVEIVDVSADAFKEFLQFLYLPNVNISNENLWEVFYLAEKYNIRGCMELCEPDIGQQITTKNVCKILDLALQFDLRRLKDHCLEKICDSKTTEILATEAFLECSKDSLKSILTVNAIGCEESDLFDACIDWAKHACETKGKCPSDNTNIRAELGDCLYSIRFGAMKPEQITKCISRNKDLFTSSELRDIWLSIESDKSAIEIFKDFTPRGDLRPWDDSRLFQCDLGNQLGGWQNTGREMARTESTVFQISKTLLFGGITVNKLTLPFDDRRKTAPRIEAKLFVFELSSSPNSPESSQHTQLLQQRIRFEVKSLSRTAVEIVKFASIRLQANRVYEVRIERNHLKSLIAFSYDGTSIGTDQQKEFGDGVTMYTKTSCSNFIRSFYFN